MLDGIEPHWIWVIIGLVLAALEIVVPGVYLIWLAVAALLTGVLTFVLDPGLPLQIVNFVFISLIAAFSAKRILRDRPILSSDPLMNKRGGRLVGESAVVVQPFEGGTGRVHLGDTDWLAKGVDMAIGERVRVTGSEGAILLVEPANLIEEQGREDVSSD
ncbi:NfeD family protein [Parerythrobacter jejuensis]|uniref:NfeD family protein n=1 Tax=Parerythrobacter jejuensis TaxID=795812 RepID=A0A845AP21_9SPHN|nr:NfeD family protein [Parerythrobacter jejuensis]MXP30655.1 NfeD family protein [Parerythrobacter jejuensis]MXP33415.1 NfeD family protein [Parerythrobacter jejuensis]